MENESKEGKAEAAEAKVIDLDYVLVHELGQFGRYQMVNLLLVSIPIIMSAFMSEYIFSAATIPHRCQISECQETGKTVADFNPDWLSGAIPPGNNVNGYDSCSRYQPVGGNGTLDYCPAQLFNTNVQQDCDAFGFVINSIKRFTIIRVNDIDLLTFVHGIGDEVIK
ncbi:hypothetical protein B5X24_HaOG204859 [Helicoverpa armigera]|uniref:Uncharacterized protein n=1 Tax=Helicoverpa armigera TaxID=29058 RepID=A0A2W1BWX8_HELAM|nr:hypothetical protein B5X24_HaOG204859 [Helicoverpa armigera]